MQIYACLHVLQVNNLHSDSLALAELPAKKIAVTMLQFLALVFLPTPLSTVGVGCLVGTMQTLLVSISSTLLLHLSAVT